MYLVIDPMSPPPMLIFAISCAALTICIVLMIAAAGIKRTFRGESFFIPRARAEGADLARAASRVRSRALKSRFSRTNGGQVRSARPNTEQPRRSLVRPFADRSNVQPGGMAILANIADIPATIDEVQQLAHTIALYAKRPNKELAIIEAWGATKGEGELYTRASRLFDTAMGDKARQAAKAKAPQIAREVEAA